MRLYSRELGLNESSLVSAEPFSSPIVSIIPTGEDSLLVYTHENILYHYVIAPSSNSVQIVQVGQIGLHGIVRAPARVRAVTWFVPDHQLRMNTFQLRRADISANTNAVDGDPSQDVVHAAVIFLVDAKLVLLKPTNDEQGALKYDMRIIANNVEYFAFIRDQLSSSKPVEAKESTSNIEENSTEINQPQIALQESLWYFDGNNMQCWTDIQDLLQTDSPGGSRDMPLPVSIPTDFYPTSIGLDKGIIVGIEPDLVQRRDAQFAYFRFSIRVRF